MKFVLNKCKNNVDVVGGSFSPSRFFVRNNSCLKSGIFLTRQSAGAYKLQMNVSIGARHNGNIFHSSSLIEKAILVSENRK